MQHTSKIILGTVQFGIKYGINNSYGMPAEQEVHQVLKLAYTNGITMLDTADAYGDAESVIAKYHALHTHTFDIVSKFKYQEGLDLRGTLLDKLTTLKAKSLYSYMYHSYSDLDKHPQLKNILKTLRSEGLIKKLGVSVYNNNEFERVLNDSDIDLVQLPFNLLDNMNIRGRFIQEAKEKNKEIHVRSVFLQGLLFKQPQHLPIKLKALEPHIQQLQDISIQTGMTINELALNYVLSNIYIDKVLIGVDSLSQLQANLSALNNLPGTAIDSLINNITVKETELLNPTNW